MRLFGGSAEMQELNSDRWIAGVLLLFGGGLFWKGLLACVRGHFVLGRNGPSQLLLTGQDAIFAGLITIIIGGVMVAGTAIVLRNSNTGD
jgi:hypothetical protein